MTLSRLPLLPTAPRLKTRWAPQWESAANPWMAPQNQVVSVVIMKRREDRNGVIVGAWVINAMFHRDGKRCI